MRRTPLPFAVAAAAVTFAVVPGTSVRAGAATTAIATIAPAAVAAETRPPCPTATITSEASQRARYLSDRLRLAGYNPAATAGILGTLDHLSALTPTARSRTGGGRGLVLWGQARWRRHVAATQGNPWSLSSQTTSLIRELTEDLGSFHHRRYQGMTDPAEAAWVMYRTFVGGRAKAADVLATRGAKARGWAQALATRAVDRSPGDNDTYGLVLPCEPVTATLESCPAVPRSFVTDFARYTRFRWSDMSEASQLVSRCVYANFPRIRIHGTYRPGHMPTWGRALDFMMPGGCTTGRDGSWTNSAADLLVGTRLAQYLLARVDRLGIDYVIWQDRGRNPGWPRFEDDLAPLDLWREDRYNNGNCTNTHYDHVHMSVRRSA